MTIKPADFQDPETPKSFREFYVLYFKDSQRLNKRLDEIEASAQEDRETFLSMVDKHREALAKQASCLDSLDQRLKVNECTTKEVHDDIKAINAKTNWLGGINAMLAIIAGAIGSLFKG